MVMIIGNIQQTIGVEETIQGEGGQPLMVDGRGCFYDGMDVLARVMLSLNQRPKSNVTKAPGIPPHFSVSSFPVCKYVIGP